MWKVVSGQIRPVDFKPHCSMESCNYKADEQNFIDFSEMNGFDEYIFKMIWTFADGSTDSLSWIQSENPLSKVNANMYPTNVVLESGNAFKDFNGLSLSSSPHTLLDGTVHATNWWYSYGYSYAGWNGGKNPAYVDANNNVLAAIKTELFFEVNAEGMSTIRCFIIKMHISLQ